MPWIEGMPDSGGGQEQKETIWTNPSPGNNFSAQSVSLSAAASRYRWIEIHFKYSRTTSESEANYNTYVRYAYDELLKYTGATGTVDGSIFIRHPDVGNAVRRVSYNSTNNTIAFTDCTKMGTSGTNNAACVPTSIIGIL